MNHLIIRRLPAALCVALALFFGAGPLRAQSPAVADLDQRVSGALEAVSVGRSINALSLGQRDSLLADIEGRVQTAAKALQAMANNAKEGIFSRTPKGVKDAVAEAEAREGELRQRIERARAATEENWSSARAELAASYSAYAGAVEKVEQAVAAEKG